jgi:uncharacterized membrane-anchored protein
MHETIHTLAHWLAPWQSAYSNSKAVSGTITFVHLAGLLFAGGFAVAADRATLRAIRSTPEQRQRVLSDLDAVHRPVLIGLGVLFASGLLQAAADVETFGTSPVYWTKMTLVVLLLVNGLVLKRTEAELRADGGGASPSPLWARLRTTAVASLILWTAIVCAGTFLVSAS